MPSEENSYEIVIGDEAIRLADIESAQTLASTLIHLEITTFQFWTVKKKMKSEGKDSE